MLGGSRLGPLRRATMLSSPVCVAGVFLAGVCVWRGWGGGHLAVLQCGLWMEETGPAMCDLPGREPGYRYPHTRSCLHPVH